MKCLNTGFQALAQRSRGILRSINTTIKQCHKEGLSLYAANHRSLTRQNGTSAEDGGSIWVHLSEGAASVDS